MTTGTLQRQVQSKAYKLIFNQTVLSMLVFFGVGCAIDFYTASGVLAGGFCYILPNWLFVFFVFKFATPSDVYTFLAAFMGGEIFKMMLSAIMMILVVKFLPLGLSSVVAGLIVAIVSFWVACFIFFYKREGVQA